MRSSIAARSVACLVCAVIGVVGCATKRVVIPPEAAARYKDLSAPLVPQELALTEAAEEFGFAWRVFQTGDLQAAEQYLRRLLRKTPTFYPASTALGYVALSRGQHAEAATQFDRVLQTSPTYAPALAGRGEALLASGKDVDALRAFEQAVAVDGSRADLQQHVQVLRLRVTQAHIAASREAAASGRLEAAHEGYARALALSPDSAFLHRELGVIAGRLGRRSEAQTHMERAVGLDARDAAAWTSLGDLFFEQQNFVEAEKSYGTAFGLEPSDALRRRLEETRDLAELARLPEEYRAISTSPTIRRGELAALLGIRMQSMVRAAPRRTTAVLTDTRGHWAGEWIRLIVQAGIMEAYPNHTFQPGATVKRAELAQAVTRMLDLIAAQRPAIAKRWVGARIKMSDIGREHLLYPAASTAVASGVLQLFDGNTFDPARPISGAEAISAIDRLNTLSVTP